MDNLKIRNLMHYSYFWELSQKKTTREITRGKVAFSNPTLLQGFIKGKRVTFQSQQGSRFVLRVQPNAPKFELYAASVKNVHFLKDEAYRPLDMVYMLSFSAGELAHIGEGLPEGIHECEIFNTETQKPLNNYLGLKHLKPGQFHFRLIDVLHFYQPMSEIKPIIRDPKSWNDMWTWEMRLELLRQIQKTNASPYVKFIGDNPCVSGDFLDLGATPTQIQEFARNCFDKGQAVLMKEKQSLYITRGWHDTASRTGAFRAVILRSLSEIYNLTDATFNPQLQCGSLTPDFLDKVRVSKPLYPEKNNRKYGPIPDRLMVESLTTKESYEVFQLPMDARQRLVKTNDFRENSVYGWVERKNNLPYSKHRLICLVNNPEMKI